MAALRLGRNLTQFCYRIARNDGCLCRSSRFYFTALNSHALAQIRTRLAPNLLRCGACFHTDGCDVGDHVTARDFLTTQRVFDVQLLVSLLQQENAVDICVIKVPEDLQYTQYFVIVSGTSPRHLRAMAQYAVTVYKFLKTDDDPHTHIEGKDCEDWMCIDFGSMVVHFMLPETRERFNLETLWTLRDYENQKDIPPYTLPSDFILTHTHTHTQSEGDTV